MAKLSYEKTFESANTVIPYRGITEWENEITINAGRRNLTKQPNEIAPRQNSFRCLSIMSRRLLLVEIVSQHTLSAFQRAS